MLHPHLKVESQYPDIRSLDIKYFQSEEQWSQHMKWGGPISPTAVLTFKTTNTNQVSQNNYCGTTRTVNFSKMLATVACTAAPWRSFFCKVSTLLNLHQQENPARTMLNYSCITGFFTDLTPSLVKCKTKNMLTPLSRGWNKNAGLKTVDTPYTVWHITRSCNSAVTHLLVLHIF